MVEKLKVDLSYLVFAWQDESEHAAYYLDTDTGSVVLVQRDLDDVDELREEIELQPNRFLYVPKADPRQVELDLFDFVFTVADEKLKTLLTLAMEAPDKAGSVRTILGKYPEQSERLRKWRDDIALQRVFKWLHAHDLEVEP